MKGITVQEMEGQQAQEVIDSDFSPLASVPDWTLVPIEKDKAAQWAQRNRPAPMVREDIWADVRTR